MCEGSFRILGLLEGRSCDCRTKEDRGAKEEISQLAKVPGPALCRRPADRAVADLDVLLELIFGEVGEMLHEAREIFGPLAQRRDVDGEDVETIVEIFAKLPLLAPVGQRLVRCGDQVGVRSKFLACSDGEELSVFEDAKKFGLQIELEFADFIEKHAALLGSFEQPFAIHHRSGEGALAVTKELALGKFFGDRATVEGDQRVVRGPFGMKGVGHDFFASAGFSPQEHRKMHLCALMDALEDRLHRRTFGVLREQAKGPSG